MRKKIGWSILSILALFVLSAMIYRSWIATLISFSVVGGILLAAYLIQSDDDNTHRP